MVGTARMSEATLNKVIGWHTDKELLSVNCLFPLLLKYSYILLVKLSALVNN